MKKHILFVLTAMAMLFSVASCGDEVEEIKLDTLIVGTWDLNGAQFTKSATIGSETVSVTVTFNADKSFSLSQIVGRGRAVEFDGNWSLAGDILSGTYSDGSSWGSQYKISIEGTVLTMTSVTGGDVYTYIKK